jgi:hypothetical protein
VILALAAALAVGGCGSSSLSDSALRSQAARVCATASAQAGEIPAPKSVAAGTVFLARGIAALSPELTQLRALRPPSDLAQEYDVSLSAFSAELTALRSTVGRLRSGADPVSAIRGLQRRLRPLESTEDGAWRTLEIPACVER